MVHLTNIVSSLGIFALAAALPSLGGKEAASGNARAVYLLSNNDQNSVVAINVRQDGTLGSGRMTATGGKGGVLIDGMTKKPATTDALASQSALAIAGDKLVAVNAGSNTISLFRIHKRDPTLLIPLGKPVDTLGDFPVSVAASERLGVACVGNTGTRAGVACFTMHDTGLCSGDGLRPFALNQTVPPVGPTNNVAHVLFNSDSSMLLTTVKGDPMKKNPGFLAAFPATADGKVSMTGAMSSPNGTAVLFGSANVATPAAGSNAPTGNIIVATDASFGAAMLSVDRDGKATTVSSTNIPNQKATCWATFSRKTRTAFVTDVGRNTLTEIDPATGKILGTPGKDVGNGNKGMIDLANAGNFVYALAPGNDSSTAAAIAVFDISGGRGAAKPIQNRKLGSGVVNNAMGLQIMV
ncbi:MAG: hypothetical protein M1825_006098 [Sarcosagium campestre]|nr:MAG: hypothetical protein M1825_006098 [Sarcosagium campestre]